MTRLLYLVLVLVLSACASDSTSSKKEQLAKEAFPKINRSQFQWEQFASCKSLLHKDMDRTEESKGAVLGEYQKLSKEQHILIEEHTIQWFKKSLAARSMKSKDLLEEFAKEELATLCGSMKQCSSAEFQESEVNGMRCLRIEFEATKFGFPKAQYFYLRCFQGKEKLYTITAWTLSENKTQFEKQVKAFSLSLTEI